MSFIALTRLIELLLLPPAGPMLLIAAGLWWQRRQRRKGTYLTIAGLVLLYLFATPLVGDNLLRALEPEQPLALSELDSVGAIVVLAGPDSYFDAPEYGGDSAGPWMLTRLRYAAELQRRSDLPIAVIGGDGLKRGTPAARYMRQILEREFDAEVKWGDGQSRHTFDNARYSAEVLQQSGVETIALVTHGWHMGRAVRAFEDSGLKVVPAPTGFTTGGPLRTGLFALIPNPESLLNSRWALHELIGRIWYALFY